MAIIIDDTDSSTPAPKLEAAVYAAKVFQGFADMVRRDIEANPNRDGSGCIEHVVRARDLQPEVAQMLVPIAHLKMTDTAVPAAELTVVRPRVESGLSS